MTNLLINATKPEHLITEISEEGTHPKTNETSHSCNRGNAMNQKTYERDRQPIGFDPMDSLAAA
jgi:hypothetical protein